MPVPTIGASRTQQRHGLTLHVRAHQRAVRVVVLEERDQRGRDRDDLLRRDVHELHALRRLFDVLFGVAAHDRVGRDLARRAVDRRVGLRDDVLVFAIGREVDDLVGDDAVVHDAVRRLDEAEPVDARIGRERADQADVRTFRRLDRTDAAVVRVVDVAHFEAGALARETARPERREAALVRQLGQRVRLVHELRELRGAEELFDRGDDRTDVDERLRRDRFDVLHGHALAHDALEAQQADAELVLQQFADRTDATVAEMIDVVLGDDAGRDFDQAANDRDHVGAREALRLIAASRARSAYSSIDRRRVDARIHIGVLDR